VFLWDDVFLDIDPKRGLAAGERWKEALRRAADRCEAVVFVVAPAWAKSTWCLAELISGVVLENLPIGELPPEMTAEWQLCYLAGPGSTETIRFEYREKPAEIAFLAEGLKRLKAGLQNTGLSASFFAWPPKGDELCSSYRGLEPLDARDAAVFFGRDAEILQGLSELRGMCATGDQGLFVILGASGAGKSSFCAPACCPAWRACLPSSRLARRTRSNSVEFHHFNSPEFDGIKPDRPNRSGASTGPLPGAAAFSGHPSVRTGDRTDRRRDLSPVAGCRPTFFENGRNENLCSFEPMAADREITG